MRRVVVVKTLTGEPVSPMLEPSQVQVTAQLVGAGTGQVAFPGSAIPEGVEQVLMSPWASTLVVVNEANEVEWAGLVQDFVWANDVLQVNCAELEVLLPVRGVYGVGGPPKDLPIVGGSLRDIMVQVLRAGLVWKGLGKSPWDLPIVWPGMDLTARQRLDVRWWRFQTIQQLLDELLARDGAPLVTFRPMWVDGVLRWKCLVGDLEPVTHALAVGTAQHPVQGGTSISVRRDGKALRSEMWVTGNGQEAEIVWGAGKVELADGVPNLVAVSAWGTVEEQGRANEIARGLLQARKDSTDLWDITVNVGEAYKLAQFRPGDRLEIQHPGDRLIPAGNYPRIILSVASDSSQTVRVTVQEVATAADRLQSGIDAVLRRLAAAETQASNRSSTTIDEIRGLVARAEQATKNAQDAADDARKRADAAAQQAVQAKQDAARAQGSANQANQAAGIAQTRANDAFSYAGRAQGAANTAAGYATAAQRAAGSAQSSANRANGRLDALKWNVQTALNVYDAGRNYTGAKLDATLWTAGRMVANGLNDWI